MPAKNAQKASSKSVKSCPNSTSGGKVGKTKPKKKRVITLRMKYLGATPGKGSAPGRKVIERMKKEIPPPGGRIRDNPLTGKQQFYEIQDGKWYDFKYADMGHIHDAVIYWNKIGYKIGPKKPAIRKWMLDPTNYRLEHRSINRSKGSILGKTNKYRDPK